MKPKNLVQQSEAATLEDRGQPEAAPGKPTDGFVSRHFNRKISAVISRQLAKTPVTPNQISIATMLVSCLAAWWMTSQVYLWFAAGGVLFQIASILDGCDGEVARLKRMASAKGEWVDTIADKISYLCFYLCITYGMYLKESDSLFLAIGLGATTLYHLIIPLEYRYLCSSGSGSAAKFLHKLTSTDSHKSWFQRLCASLSFACRRDFFAAACCVLALLNRLDIIYWLFVTGSVLVFSTVARQSIRWTRRPE